MKKSFRKFGMIIGMTSLLGSGAVYAQDAGSNGDISGSVGKPATLKVGEVDTGGFFRWLGDRIHTLELGGKAYEMEKDGVSERSYVAAFTSKGALVYNHELVGEDIHKGAGKNAGMQLLPYTISMTDDGRTFFSVAGLAFKNMVTASAHNVTAGRNYYGEKYDYDGLFHVIDNLQALVFEYDKNYAIQGVETMKLKFASIDMKLDLLGSSSPGTFIAITGGGDIGLHRTTINHEGRRHVITAERQWGYSPDKPKDGIGGFNASVRYGLEYNQPVSGGWNVNSKVGVEHIWSNGKAINPEVSAKYNQDKSAYDQAMESYPQELSAYESRKSHYEMNNTNGTELSHESYSNLSGDMKPIKPTFNEKQYDEGQLDRSLMYLTPSIQISKRVSGEGKRPVKLGLGVYGNIPMKDNVQGFDNFDMTNMNRELVGAKLILNF